MFRWVAQNYCPGTVIPREWDSKPARSRILLWDDCRLFETMKTKCHFSLHILGHSVFLWWRRQDDVTGIRIGPWRFCFGQKGDRKMEQTCQRCGNPTGCVAPAGDFHENVYVSVMIGMWDREYRLCDLCARILQGFIEEVIEDKKDLHEAYCFAPCNGPVHREAGENV